MINIVRDNKGNDIYQEPMAKTRSFVQSGKHDDVMLEIICDVLINDFGNATDGKIKLETFVEAIKKFNKRTNEIIQKKHLKN